MCSYGASLGKFGVDSPGTPRNYVPDVNYVSVVHCGASLCIIHCDALMCTLVTRQLLVLAMTTLIVGTYPGAWS